MLAAAQLTLGEGIPRLNAAALGYTLAGALAQIAATALMLVAMTQRSFGVAYAYIKTEPILVAVLGVILLGDRLAPLSWLGVFIATAGILIVSVNPRAWRALLVEWRPMVTGIASGACFGLSSVVFRGGITGLEEGGALMRALTIMVTSLFIQSALLAIWLGLFDRKAFTGSLRVWRESLGAGFLGALATAGWFLAFSLTAAANVRTLGLVEMPIAGWLNRRISGAALSLREWCGTAMVVAGIAMLLAQLIS